MNDLQNNKKSDTTPMWYDTLLGVVKCLFQKHKLTEGEIQGKRFRYCERCKYTQYMFLFGWGKIKRTKVIQDYIDNND
jgi:hypothetical protein